MLKLYIIYIIIGAIFSEQIKQFYYKDQFYLAMICPLCDTVNIKDPLLVGSPCIGICGFPLSPSGWSFTICPTPYNCKWNVLSALWNKTLPSFQTDRQTDTVALGHASHYIHHLCEWYNHHHWLFSVCLPFTI